MTHSEIYKKFFIEYDKDSITSSYPSLTLVEVCNFLNKAYLALIAQKLIGNNPRQVVFEGDIKVITDLQQLIHSNSQCPRQGKHELYNNVIIYDFPTNDTLYPLEGTFVANNEIQNVSIVSHEVAKRFAATNVNLPWIESPVATIENDKILVYYDAYKYKNLDDPNSAKLYVTYIKKPKEFAPTSLNVQFELNDNMVEELINLAITFVLNNVESSKLEKQIGLLKFES